MHQPKQAHSIIQSDGHLVGPVQSTHFITINQQSGDFQGSKSNAAAMENKEKLILLCSISLATCFAVAISIHFTKHFQRQRKRNSTHSKRSPCYLETETAKPQRNFNRVLADNSYSHFKHLKLPATPQHSSTIDECLIVHPYKDEVTELVRYPKAELLKFFQGELKELEMGDEYVWVDTERQLTDLAEVLSKETVFGVDTEQHSLRSFLGFTALIQISTKAEDYLVDTIALHDVMGVLRPVFANPAICKVFHGADNDVLWLQRDFHIYVVNLFDTAKACDILSKPQRSLAYLLESYCGVTKNKILQREDWRQRPLPADMVQYARTDAHYLLYIAESLSSELKQQDSSIVEKPSDPNDEFHFLLEASQRSNATCLQLFSKESEAFPGESAASSIIFRYLNDQGSTLSSAYEFQFQGLVRKICAWRDIMARMHDESLRYVLSEQAIIALATKAPASETEIYNTISEADLNADSLTINFFQSPSAVVCSHLIDLEYLLRENASNLDDILQMIIEKHLGSAGTCPISLYNYGLLSKSSLKLSSRSISKLNGPRPQKQVHRKSSRQLFVQKFSCKSPVYHNCKIYANDGRLLCNCDRKKLEWYLNRNLAKLVEDDPPAIMLLFEPKGRPEDEGNDFYIQSKKNICVGCGEGNHYLRYRIIPSCYRMHFPEHLKSHRSHDIVLLCVDCHEIAHAAAERHKRQIAKEFGIPLYVRHVVDSNESEKTSESMASPMNMQEAVGVSPLHLRTAAMALLRHGRTMPSKRCEELTKIVMKFYGGREISENDLEQALLVGMTPHERRRFEKKRGLATKQSESNAESEDFAITNKKTVVNRNANLSPAYNSYSNNHQSHFGGGSEDEACRAETDIISAGLTPLNDYLNPVVPENGNVSDGTRKENVSAKPNSKYSLLGHGPHGKQVVDYLLRQDGDDGIREFCQRWRLIFVDALHPRFLPVGWDVRHRYDHGFDVGQFFTSGKRHFGEYSVYNPAKKVSSSAASSG